jgi:hypothetical protein
MGGVFNYVNLHAYHYAGNNPVKYVDPDGRAAGDTFESVDEAAKDWAKEYYGATNFILFEQSSLIYKVYDENKKSMVYSYTPALIGTPHGADTIWDGKKNIPENGIYIGYIHSHPNSKQFSEPDKIIARNSNTIALVVVPGASRNVVDIKKYSDTRRGWRETTVERNVRFNEISEVRKGNSFYQYRSKWDNHIKAGCNFNCINKTWPGR